MDSKAISNSILDSYRKIGTINLKSENRFPAREDIEKVLHLMKELLFPGFFANDQLDSKSLESLTEERVEELYRLLGDVLVKSFAQEDDQAQKRAQESLVQFMGAFPQFRERLKEDAEAIYDGDPAAKSIEEVILSYPGFLAVMVYRLAHFLYQLEVPLVPRLMSEIVHSETGIDIHPGAVIGRYFCIDHGTGIVVGETAIIGDNVKLYQGVTLGAFSVSKGQTEGRRHPKLGNHVTVYARSTILGGNTTIGDHSIIGGNVWLTESLPDYSTIYLSSDYKQVLKKRKSADS